MMKHTLIVCCLLVAGSRQAPAKIWRVNNNAGMANGTSVFATLQGAVNAAASGDTIHVEGSVTEYDASVTVAAKRLYIFGPGYDLAANPETQHLKQNATVRNIVFAAGSNGSILAGVAQASASYAVTINADTVKITGCRLFNVEIKNDRTLKNIDIRRCWLWLGKIYTAAGLTATVENLNIVNNFMGSATANFDAVNLDANTKALIANNTFYNGFRITAANTGTRVTGNVFFAVTTCNLNAPSSPDQYTRNLFNTALGGMSNGQQNNTLVADTNPLKWFSGDGGSTTLDKYFTARPGTPSPVIDAAGVAGEQLGMYGGLSPYALSGMVNIPSVYEIAMPTEVSAAGFEVTVKVKAH